jgi:hypothetical protein
MKKKFTEKEFNSGDGMLTSVWGPSMWHYLHTMSFNYPHEPTCKQKHDYHEFIMTMKKTLPCGKCRKNLETNFKKLPLTMNELKSRSSFSRYIYNLHELINEMLGKKSGLTYETVRERYEHFRARCTKSFKELKKTNKCKTKKRTQKHKEKGCTQPLYGEKSKCIIKIVPQKNKTQTFSIDKTCFKHTS